MRGHNVWGNGCAVASALLVACVPHLEPLEPIETDRPDRTESASLVPRGMVQVEAGATVARNDGVHSTTVGETLVRVGLHERLEIRVEPFTHTRVTTGVFSEGGLEDLAVGIKTPLLRAEGTPRAVPKVSLLLATSLPTGRRAFRAAGAEPEAVLAAQWELNQALGFGTNLTARRGNDANRYWERGASATLGLALNERAGSYIEWYATRDDRDASAFHVINGGLTYKLSSDAQLDARVGKGTREQGGFAGIGIARRW